MSLPEFYDFNEGRLDILAGMTYVSDLIAIDPIPLILALLLRGHIAQLHVHLLLSERA